MSGDQPAVPAAARPWAAIVAATSSGAAAGGDGNRAASARTTGGTTNTSAPVAAAGSGNNNAAAPPSSSSSPGPAKAGSASTAKPAEVRASPDSSCIEREGYRCLLPCGFERGRSGEERGKSPSSFFLFSFNIIEPSAPSCLFFFYMAQDSIVAVATRCPLSASPLGQLRSF